MTVALFDRRTVLRDALKLAFSPNKNMKVICETGNMYNTLDYVKKTTPDAVLLDPALFGNQLLHFIHAMMKFNQNMKFVLLPASDDCSYYPDDWQEQNVTVLSAKDGMDKVVRTVIKK